MEIIDYFEEIEKEHGDFRINGKWYVPLFGSDTIQHIIDDSTRIEKPVRQKTAENLIEITEKGTIILRHIQHDVYVGTIDPIIRSKDFRDAKKVIAKINSILLEKFHNPHFKYLVKSGEGYAMENVETPLMTTNYIEAKRFDTYGEAETLQTKLLSKGMDAEIIILKIGNYTG